MGAAGLAATTIGVVIDAMDRNRETTCLHGGARRPDRASPLRAIPLWNQTHRAAGSSGRGMACVRTRAGRTMKSAPAPVRDLARAGPTAPACVAPVSFAAPVQAQATQVLVSNERVDFNLSQAAPGVFHGVARGFRTGATSEPDPWAIAQVKVPEPAPGPGSEAGWRQ